jgi:drug/metabolite transporter (DMT)-like permease
MEHWIGFLCALFYALYLALFKEVAKYKSLAGFTRVSLVAIISMLLAVFFDQFGQFNMWALIFLPVFFVVTGGVFFFFVNALAECGEDSATVYAIKNTDAGIIVILGVFLFKENLFPFQLLGICMIILSALTMSIEWSKFKEEKTSCSKASSQKHRVFTMFTRVFTFLKGFTKKHAIFAWISAFLSGVAYVLAGRVLSVGLGVGPFWAIFSSTFGASIFFIFRFIFTKNRKEECNIKQLLKNKKDLLILLAVGMFSAGGANAFTWGATMYPISIMATWLSADVALTVVFRRWIFRDKTPLWKWGCLAFMFLGLFLIHNSQL